MGKSPHSGGAGPLFPEACSGIPGEGHGPQGARGPEGHGGQGKEGPEAGERCNAWRIFRNAGRQAYGGHRHVPPHAVPAKQGQLAGSGQGVWSALFRAAGSRTGQGRGRQGWERRKPAAIALSWGTARRA